PVRPTLHPYILSLPDALPILISRGSKPPATKLVAADQGRPTPDPPVGRRRGRSISSVPILTACLAFALLNLLVLGACKRSSKPTDRKSTRLNSSHVAISYAVF